MKKFWFQMIGLIVLIMAATFLTFNQKYLIPITKSLIQKPTSINTSTQAKKSILKIVSEDGSEKARLNIELADDKEKRTKGLGYRDSLATDSGMLFLHEQESRFSYWMKGMRFPIDFIWIKDDTVVDTTTNAYPPVEGQSDDTLVRYSPSVAVNKVLETNLGYVAQNNIQTGDKIILQNSN